MRRKLKFGQRTSQSSSSEPIESWWSGGKGPMLIIQELADVVAPPENGRSLKKVGHIQLRSTRPQPIKQRRHQTTSTLKALPSGLSLSRQLRAVRAGLRIHRSRGGCSKPTHQFGLPTSFGTMPVSMNSTGAEHEKRAADYPESQRRIPRAGTQGLSRMHSARIIQLRLPLCPLTEVEPAVAVAVR